MLYVSVQSVKEQLRIDDDSEDEQIAGYIEAAQADAEARIRRPIYSENPEDNPVTTDPEAIPALLRQYILLTTGDFYRNRENKQEKQYTTYFEHLLDSFVDYKG
jgi:hypothetical protein